MTDRETTGEPKKKRAPTHDEVIEMMMAEEEEENRVAREREEGDHPRP